MHLNLTQEFLSLSDNFQFEQINSFFSYWKKGSFQFFKLKKSVFDQMSFLSKHAMYNDQDIFYHICKISYINECLSIEISRKSLFFEVAMVSIILQNFFIDWLKNGEKTRAYRILHAAVVLRLYFNSNSSSTNTPDIFYGSRNVKKNAAIIIKNNQRILVTETFKKFSAQWLKSLILRTTANLVIFFFGTFSYEFVICCQIIKII